MSIFSSQLPTNNNMFSSVNYNSNSNPLSLSTYSQSSSLKRQHLRSKIRSQQYEKLRKTQRQQLILQQQQPYYNSFIQQTSVIPLSQFQMRIKQILPNLDLTEIIITLTHFKYSLNFQQPYTIQLFSKLLQLVQEKIFKFQSISLIDLMTKINKDIVIKIVEETDILPKIVENILSMKQCDIQSFYMIGLDNIIRVYQKNSHKRQFKYSSLILTIINNKQTNKIDQLMLLKTISIYITPSNPLPEHLIERILSTFEYSINNPHDNIKSKYQHQQQLKQILINSFLILNKVVYYHQKINLAHIYKMIKMFLYDKEYLSQHIVQNYHNIWMLIGILIKKMDVYELQYLQKQQKQQFIKQYIGQQQQQQQDFKSFNMSQHSIPTVIMSHILTQYPSILSLHQFSTPYLIFLNYLTQFCQPSIITSHFIRHQIFPFLQQCIDHHDKQIIIVSLETLINMFKGQSERIELAQYIKNATRIKQILEDKYHYEKHKSILNKIVILMEKLEEHKA